MSKIKNLASNCRKHVGNLMFMYRQIFSISKIRIFLVVLQCIISNAYLVVDIYFLKYIVEGLIGGRSLTYFAAVIAVKLGTLLLMQCCDNIFENYVFKKIDVRIEKELAIRLFDRIKDIKLSKMESPEYYNKYEKAVAEVGQRSGALIGYFTYVLSTLLNIVSLTAIISSLNVAMIIISLVGMLVTVWANIANTKNVYDANMSFVDTDRKINYVRRIFYLPQYAKDIRRTNLPQLLKRKYNDAIDEKQGLIKKHWPKIIAIAVSGSWLYNVVNVGASYLYLAIKAMQQVISVGDVTSLAYAVNQLSNNFLQISNIIPQAIQHSLYIQNYKDMFDAFSEEDLYAGSDKAAVTCAGDIRLEHVSFSYVGANAKAIDDICLSIRNGEHLAIVGENGSGKTTLVKLLSALYDPSDGRISMGGVDYRNISFKSLSSLFGIVDQDFQHYAFSISENLSIQCDGTDVDDERARDSLKKVNIYDAISKLDNGVDSVYSKEFDKDGVDFSGGQLQRLAIARALYSDAPIMIFDEPSSALDPIGEQKLFDTIYENCAEKTLIMVSHRLSCVKDMDRIIVLDKGRIIEMGSHAELMHLDGKYAEMFKLQGERYGLDKD